MKFYFEEKHRRKSGLCHNCDSILAEKDNFCNYCGQENHDLKVPIPHILEEVVEGLSHFDNKFFTTLKSLFLKPGQITKDFLSGKRTRFVPPLRLFFFISGFFFFLNSCSETKTKDLSKNPEQVAEWVKETTPVKALNKFEVKSTDSLKLILPQKTLIEQKKIIHNLYKATLEDSVHTHPFRIGPVSRAYFKQLHRDLKLPVPDTIILRSINLDEKVKISIGNNKDYWVAGQGLTRATTGRYLTYNDRQLDSVYLATEHKLIQWYEHVMIKLSRQYIYDSVLAAEKDENYKRVVSNKALNYTTFLMIPLVGFLLWLFFSKAKSYYYEHLIFSINYHSLLFIISSFPFVLHTLFGVYFDDLVGGYSSTVILSGMWIYFLISAKNVFEQTWLRTTIKALAFGLCYALFFVVVYYLVTFYCTSVLAYS